MSKPYAKPSFPLRLEGRPPHEIVNFLKDWFGLYGWALASPTFSEIGCCGCFRSEAERADIPEWALPAWYDLYNGEGAFRSRCEDDYRKHADKEYNQAFECVQAGSTLATDLGFPDAAVVPVYEGPRWLEEHWNQGIADASVTLGKVKH